MLFSGSSSRKTYPGLDELVRRHLLEAHLEEDLPELVADLVQGMQSASVLHRAEGLEVVRLEVDSLPCARGKQVRRQVGLLLLDLQRELGTLANLEADDLLRLQKLALLQVDENLEVVCLVLLDVEQLFPRDILN